MKETAIINVSAARLSPGDLQRLMDERALSIEVRGEAVSVSGDPSTSAFRRVLGLLEELGYSALQQQGRAISGSNEYLLRIRREYAVEELLAFEYCVLVPEVYDGAFRALSTRSNGGHLRIRLSAARARPCVADAAYCDHWIVMPESFAQSMSSLRLVGAEYVPTELWDDRKGKDCAISWPGEQMMELTSRIQLPNMSSTCEFYDRSWNRVRTSSDTETRRLVEGFYVAPEPRYRRDDLAAIGEFDVSLSAEGVVWGQDRTRRMRVVSRRIVEHFHKNKLGARFVPVRLH